MGDKQMKKEGSDRNEKKNRQTEELINCYQTK